MPGRLNNAHGTVVIDGDFSAFDVNARRSAQAAKVWEEAIDSISRKARQQLAMVGAEAGKVATATEGLSSATNKAGEASKRRTKLTFEERKELELLRRETKRLAEEERVNSSARIQTKRGEVSALIQEEHRLTNAQAQEMRKRQQQLRQMMASVPSGSMAASPSSMMSALPGMTAFGSFHSRFQSAQQRQQMILGGMTPSQALFSQLNQVASASNQRYMMNQAIAGAPPPVFGGNPPPGGGNRGSGVSNRNFLGPGGLGARIAGGLRGGLGMGLGFFGAVQAGREVVELSQLATAYDRQRVAAERLAGSQAQLNALLDAYNRASGGAIDNVTSLENVTRLQATGFAKSASQVERFIRGARGASIALGKPQDYIIQETQLAISNTSVKRLDQIGLGIEEVSDRTEDLREANKGLTREMAFAEAVMSLMNEKYGTLTTSIEGQATGLEKLQKAWKDLRLAMGQQVQGSVNVVAGGIASGLDMSDNPKTNQVLMNFVNVVSRVLLAGKGIDPDAVFEANRRQQNLTAMDDRMVNAGVMSASIRSRGRPEPRFDEEELQSISDFHNRRSQMEEQFSEERLRETEQYEQQRSTVIRNFAKQMAREEEDFARQRARSTRDYNKQIEDFHEDAAKRDAEMLEDYNDAISKMREDNEERVADIQKEYNEDREKAEKEHLDRLLSAAADLNAFAVLEERKRYRKENEEREKAYNEQLDEARENLEEQKKEAKDAYEERLADAKEADEERLRDMREAREQQIADEDEDRAIRLGRAQEDHDDQLAELDRQHELRLKQIEDQARKEREAWDKEFEQLLLDMGIYVKGLTEKEAERNKLIEDWFDKMIEKMEKDIETRERFSRRGPGEVPEEVPAGFANGGPVRKTGLATVHKGEYVLSNAMLSGRTPVPASIAGSIMHSNSRSVVISEGAISISAVPGDSMEYLSDLVTQKMIDIIEAT